jgi:hypothetical protein
MNNLLMKDEDSYLRGATFYSSFVNSDKITLIMSVKPCDLNLYHHIITQDFTEKLRNKGKK